MYIIMIANDTAFLYNLRREVLIGLLDKKHKVAVIGQILGFKKELEKYGCKVIEVEMERRGTNPLADLRLLDRYRRILQTEKPDIVFTNNIKPNIYAGLVCRWLKIRYIENITGLGTSVEIPGLLQMLTTKLYRIGVAGAQTILFQNQENEQFFLERHMINKGTTVMRLPGSGVNLESHSLLEYPKGKIRFLYVARVMREKGIDLFLATAYKIRLECADIEFHICGRCDDPKYLDILYRAQEEGYIQYHGLQKDVTPFYEQCSCLLYPSYYPEGMSNVLLEAAACGRPVIAADRSGCREIVEDGVTGYVVPVNDENATVAVVKKFLALSWEDRRNMGVAGRRKMEREFDREFVVKEYIDIVNALQN